MARNTLAREFANETQRTAKLTKLEKTNRENRVASHIMAAFLNDLKAKGICGTEITNACFRSYGLSLELEDGSTIAIRVTAYPPK